MFNSLKNTEKKNCTIDVKLDKLDQISYFYFKINIFFFHLDKIYYYRIFYPTVFKINSSGLFPTPEVGANHTLRRYLDGLSDTVINADVRCWGGGNF